MVEEINPVKKSSNRNASATASASDNPARLAGTTTAWTAVPNASSSAAMYAVITHANVTRLMFRLQHPPSKQQQQGFVRSGRVCVSACEDADGADAGRTIRTCSEACAPWRWETGPKICLAVSPRRLKTAAARSTMVRRRHRRRALYGPSRSKQERVPLNSVIVFIRSDIFEDRIDRLCSLLYFVFSSSPAAESILSRHVAGALERWRYSAYSSAAASDSGDRGCCRTTAATA